jgi:hypothetical protein
MQTQGQVSASQIHQEALCRATTQIAGHHLTKMLLVGPAFLMPMALALVVPSCNPFPPCHPAFGIDKLKNESTYANPYKAS